MRTALFTHAACLSHDPGSMHPESPARLRAVLGALEAEEFALLDRREAPRADIADIARVHSRSYIERVLASIPPSDAEPDDWYRALDGDTVVSPGSGEAALRAAGAAVAAVDAVMAGEVRNAFCAVRPPGHHAEADHAMGFCLFNNVAIAAEHVRAVHGLARIAVMDFDVHHGNGTQHMFESDGGLFYASTHQMPLYPGTGAIQERGVGNIINVPLSPMAGSAAFREAITHRILPALEKFNPEFLIISAGFDAHAADPLAALQLTAEDFFWVTASLTDLARRLCSSRVISCLEGGYDLEALGLSAAAHVRALMVG